MRLGALVAALALIAAPASAMTFEKVAGPVECAERTCVVARGLIDEDSVRDFERFARENGVGRGALVALDSEGGNVMQSLRLGGLFRKLDVTTAVQAYDPSAQAFTPGATCVSACVYAFLGGVERRLGGGAKLGVHQAAAPKDRPWQLSAADGQWLMSLVAVHLNTMGARLELLTLALRTHPDDMRYLTRDELVRYAVVTDGRGGAD